MKFFNKKQKKNKRIPVGRVWTGSEWHDYPIRTNLLVNIACLDREDE